MNCVGDGISRTTEMVAWRLGALAERIGLDKARLLETYRANLPATTKKPQPAKPSVSSATRKAEVGRKYGMAIVGTNYEWGTMNVTAGRPYWAAEQAAPPAREVLRASCLCAGCGNLTQRASGSFSGQAEMAAMEPELLRAALAEAGMDEFVLVARVPEVGDGDAAIPRSGQYYGGTMAYWPFYEGVAEPFDPNEDYPDMTLLLRRFRSWGTDEGHVAMLIYVNGRKTVMQSYANAYGDVEPGCTVDVPLEASHAGYFYERAVVPGRRGWFD